MPRVVIVQRRMTHYRVPLFELMRGELHRHGMELVVLSGDATAAEATKKDSGTLAWAHHLRTRYWLDGRVCWQPFGEFLQPGDLVVITQENRLLYNHWLTCMTGRSFSLAFWGHGRNFQSNRPAGLKEKFKAWTTRQVDWWFAYTEVSLQAIAAAGFPSERITLLNNSIDTHKLQAERDAVTPESVAALRAQFGFEGCPVAVFIGALTEEKRLDFLIDACERVHSGNPAFRLLIIGDGPRRAFVEAAARRHSWLVWVGALSGEIKARHLAMADVLLMPGMVGLVILDAFVFGLPMITTDCGIHSPEIAYLENGRNGLLVENTLDAYASAVGDLLKDDRGRLSSMADAAKESARTFSLEAMAHNFCQGILTAFSVLGSGGSSTAQPVAQGRSRSG